MCTGEVSHDVTIFSGTPLCHFTLLERGLCYQTTWLRDPFSSIWGAATCRRLENWNWKKTMWWCKKFHCVNVFIHYCNKTLKAMCGGCIRVLYQALLWNTKLCPYLCLCWIAGRHEAWRGPWQPKSWAGLNFFPLVCLDTSTTKKIQWIWMWKAIFFFCRSAGFAMTAALEYNRKWKATSWNSLECCKPWKVDRQLCKQVTHLQSGTEMQVHAAGREEKVRPSVLLMI